MLLSIKMQRNKNAFFLHRNEHDESRDGQVDEGNVFSNFCMMIHFF